MKAGLKYPPDICLHVELMLERYIAGDMVEMARFEMDRVQRYISQPKFPVEHYRAMGGMRILEKFS